MSEQTMEMPVPPEAVTFVMDPEAVDPAAPFGRFQNGKARKRPAKTEAKRSTRSARSSSGPQAPKAAPRRTPPRRPAAPDFRPVIAEGMTVLSVPFMALGRFNRGHLATAATLQMQAEPVAHALNEVAKINPGVQRVLESSAPAVPYVLLGTALFQLGAQIAANYGMTLPGMRVQEPEQLAAQMEAQMQAAAQQDAAAQQEAQREAAARQEAAAHGDDLRGQQFATAG